MHPATLFCAGVCYSASIHLLDVVFHLTLSHLRRLLFSFMTHVAVLIVTTMSSLTLDFFWFLLFLFLRHTAETIIAV